MAATLPVPETPAEQAKRIRQRGFTTADYRAARAIRLSLMETDGDTLYAELPTPEWLIKTAKLIAASRRMMLRARRVSRGVHAS